MNRVAVIVEGETEYTFVRDHLATHLGELGLWIWPVLPGRIYKRGGVRSWKAIRSDVLRTLKGGQHCTTMFDFYAMPTDWPGRTEASQLSCEQRGGQVEAALLQDIIEHAGSDFRPELFIPYVQVHEFEALAFADVEQLVNVAAPLQIMSSNVLRKKLMSILEEAGAPEAINDGYETCPSRRIISLVPGYRKKLHSPIVASRIGLNKLRAQCPHFNEWLTKLEGLSSGVKNGDA